METLLPRARSVQTAISRRLTRNRSCAAPWDHERAPRPGFLRANLRRTAVGLLFGAVFVPLAVPIAAVAVTLADVLVRGKEPATEEVPTVLFGSGDLASTGGDGAKG